MPIPQIYTICLLARKECFKRLFCFWFVVPRLRHQRTQLSWSHRLVLHFDINKTLIIEDAVGGMSITNMLNSLLCEHCWGGLDLIDFNVCLSSTGLAIWVSVSLARGVLSLLRFRSRSHLGCISPLVPHLVLIPTPTGTCQPDAMSEQNPVR